MSEGWYLMRNYKDILIKISSILMTCFIFVLFPIVSYASIDWDNLYPVTSVVGYTDVVSSSGRKKDIKYVYNLPIDSSKGNVYIFFYSNSNGVIFQVAISNSRDIKSLKQIITFQNDSTSEINFYSTLTSSVNIDGEYVYYRTLTSFVGNYGAPNSNSTPFMSSKNLNDAIREFLNFKESKEDLGYIKNISYHVDSYGLENNPVGTNELISWGQFSTTDIDLSDSRYKVEFALRDTSTMTNRNMYESFLNQFPRIGVQLGPINLNVLETTSFLALTGQHLASMFYPSGSEKQAVLRGQAVRTDLFGKVTSLGLYPASNRSASLNCFGAYKRYFADITENNAFKRYIDSVGSSSTRNDFYNNAKDYFSSYGANYNVSYDIMARIVDSSTGNKGEWISINKHNTPYIDSDRNDRLNSGVTCTTGITMGDTVINEGDFVSPNVYSPSYIENEGDTAIYLPTKIITGYVDNSNSSSLVKNYYTNYEYNYGDTFIYNEYPNVGVTTDDDGEVKYTDDGSATENINHALRIFKYIWQKYTTWFNKLFGSWLPDWAKHIVIISLPISFTGILFKIAKQILPLLGNLALRLIEIGSGLFLPG